MSKANRLAAILQTLGEAYLARGQYAEAVEKLEQLIKTGSAEPRVHRDLAMAYAGLGDVSEAAQRAYLSALRIFPQDEKLGVKVCEVLLRHKARSDFAMQCYQLVLAAGFPLTREIYDGLYWHLDALGHLHQALDALKKVVELETGSSPERLRRLLELGRQLRREEEIREILQRLASRNSGAASIRRLQALDQAYAVLRGEQVESTRLFAAALSEFQSIENLQAAREYCTLGLALESMPGQVPTLSAPESSESIPTHGDQSDLSHAGTVSTHELPDAANILAELYRRLPQLPRHGETTASAPVANSNRHLLVLKICNLENIARHSGEQLARSLAAKFVDFAAKHLSKAAEARCLGLADGLLAFAGSLKLLAMAAVDLLHKIDRYNSTTNKAAHIFVHLVAHSDLAAHAEPPAANELRALVEALHLLEAKPEAGKRAPDSASNRLLVAREVYEQKIGSAAVPAKLVGRLQSEMPGVSAEAYEAVWRNPLEYVHEKNPYQLGRFLITAKLRGSRIAGTYLGRDRQLERTVILKALSPQASFKHFQNPARREQLLHAIRNLGRLELPGIAAIYDMGYQDEIFFFVREYLEGKSLEHVLQNRRRLPPLDTIAIGVRMCRALQPAHRQQIIHGNLKPSNVWLFANGSLKLVDFFLPGFGERPDWGGALDAGEWQYRAPECLHEDKLSPQSDVYALGVMLYELMAGERPFPSESNPSHLESLAFSFSEEMNLPPLYREVIARACRASATERFQNLMELENALMAARETLTNGAHDQLSRHDHRSRTPTTRLLEAKNG